MVEPFRPSTVEHPRKQVDNKEIIVGSLDDVLERYLHLLDHYQALQQSLTPLLSRGYLSLAQANFSNPNRVRFGQEFYDGRMEASARVSISDSSPSFSTLEPRADGGDDDDEVNTVKASIMTDDSLSPYKGTEVELNRTRDPVNWFGILVPPALRTSQSSFKDAVVDIIPALVSISREMREAEIEVRRTRKKLKKAV